ncbi:NAD(P)/FAD-dependent oxidoreductase [Streptomyces sp. I05A-00742]|uniref:flavin-containing monooxygenase n=1 Tax=Streptomyces sp. I05A-00742 TaxID=2732853 RepID=UPI002017B68F|nr:NAD(P)/FAD-dependent oxidoreductase [Streptomyces sp. I05A-00742]
MMLRASKPAGKRFPSLNTVRRRRGRPADAPGRRAVEALVIGAGPSGLSAAAMLERCGVGTVVLERTDRLAAPWHDHYDGLRLQSPNWMSFLPGLPFSRADGTWVTRERLLDYLSRYVAHHGIEVRHGVEVKRVDRGTQGWSVATSDGEWQVPVVVVATGYNRVPFVPDWPGLDGFTGQVLHASAFRNAAPFTGRDVLVVGTGNSGAEIASIVSRGGVRRTRLAVRTAPHVVRRSLLGVPTLLGPAMVETLPPRLGDLLLGPVNRLTVGDLAPYGLPAPRTGLYSQYRANGVTPVIDTGFLGALKAGLIEPVAAVDSFQDAQVILDDRSRVRPEVVIAATGYRRGLDALVGHLDVLDEDGDPVADGARPLPGAPGFYFMGYTHPFSGNLRRVRRDAPRLAREVADYLDRQAAAPSGVRRTQRTISTCTGAPAARPAGTQGDSDAHT